MGKILYPSYTYGKLDPQAEKVLLKIAESNGRPLSSLSPEEARNDPFPAEWLGERVKNVETKDIKIDGSSYQIPLRIYTPKGTGPFPVLVYYHGGGFVTGNLDEVDPLCRRLSVRIGCIIVSVDYRLAPENKFPAAVEDSADSLKWVINNAAEFRGDPSRIAVAGESAGANLAAVSAIAARDEGYPPLVHQVLLCPWVDARLTETESYKYFGDGLWLSRDSMLWFRNHYLQNEEQAFSPCASPLLAKKLCGLPPALIITAEFDVLRNEAEEFADRLKSSDVPVQLTCYEGMLHGFVTLPGLFTKAERAADEICSSLRKAFNL